MLRDALDRDRLLDRLWVAVANWPRLADVVQREHEDLLRGDIPLFTTRPNSTDLLSSSGKEIRGFFDEPTIDRVRRRVLRLSEPDLVGLVDVIESSFSERVSSTVGASERQAV